MRKKNDVKKKKRKEKQRLEWATGQFQFVLGHDTTVCIVTGKAGRLAWGP